MQINERLCSAEKWPLLLTVRQAAELAQIGRQAMYNMCRIPGFPVIKNGKKWIIPRDAFLKWMEILASDR